MNTIYLDHAAATPVSRRVLQAMQPYYSEKFYNPSALYLAAQAVATDLEQAREMVARQIGARPSEVIFTAGGTEANNLALRGVAEQHPSSSVLVSAIEHDSIIEPAKQHHVGFISVDQRGLIDLDDMKRKIDDTTALVSVGYVNSEVGTVQDLTAARQVIDEVIKDRKQRSVTLPLLLHTDACQAGNYLPLHVHKIGVDLMTLNGGKIYGPKQSGALYVRAGIELTPLIRGGGQEFGKRSGTENVASSIGFAVALEEAQSKRQAETKRLQQLQHLFIEKLALQLPSATINGSPTHRVANNVHMTVPGIDNERLMMELDERGVICAVGSACSASKDTPSHVLQAIGLSDEAAQSSLRFTLGRDTTESEIATVVTYLKEIIT